MSGDMDLFQCIYAGGVLNRRCLYLFTKSTLSSWASFALEDCEISIIQLSRKNHLPKGVTFCRKYLFLNYNLLHWNPTWNWFLCMTLSSYHFCSFFGGALLSQDLLFWHMASNTFLFVFLDGLWQSLQELTAALYTLQSCWMLAQSYSILNIFSFLIRLAWWGIEHSSLVLQILFCTHWIFNRSHCLFSHFHFFCFIFN